MAVTRDEAAALALEVANREWGYPTEDEEWVILDAHVAESDLAWAFTYNTRSFVETGDIMRAMGVGNGPIIVVKATGAVHTMESAFSSQEALKAFASGQRGY